MAVKLELERPCSGAAEQPAGWRQCRQVFLAINISKGGGSQNKGGVDHEDKGSAAARRLTSASLISYAFASVRS